MFWDSKSYFWDAFQLFFGLEPRLSPKVAPEMDTQEIMATEKWEHSDALEGAEVLTPGEASRKVEVSKEKMEEQDDTSEGADVLAQEELSGKMKAAKEKMEDTEWGDMSEKPCWRKVVNASGTMLITLVVLSHIYFA